MQAVHSAPRQRHRKRELACSTFLAMWSHAVSLQQRRELCGLACVACIATPSKAERTPTAPRAMQAAGMYCNAIECGQHADSAARHAGRARSTFQQRRWPCELRGSCCNVVGAHADRATSHASCVACIATPSKAERTPTAPRAMHAGCRHVLQCPRVRPGPRPRRERRELCQLRGNVLHCHRLRRARRQCREPCNLRSLHCNAIYG